MLSLKNTGKNDCTSTCWKDACQPSTETNSEGAKTGLREGLFDSDGDFEGARTKIEHCRTKCLTQFRGVCLWMKIKIGCTGDTAVDVEHSNYVLKMHCNVGSVEIPLALCDRVRA